MSLWLKYNFRVEISFMPKLNGKLFELKKLHSDIMASQLK